MIIYLTDPIECYITLKSMSSTKSYSVVFLNIQNITAIEESLRPKPFRKKHYFLLKEKLKCSLSSSLATCFERR